MAKRRRMNEFFEDDNDGDSGDDDGQANGKDADDDQGNGPAEQERPVQENLRQFQVLDEVQGDNSEEEEEDAGGEMGIERVDRF